MNAPLPQHHSLKTLTAFILAGERPNVIDPVAAAGGVALKALLPIGGVPMLLRVITSLRAVPAIGQIVVCASRLEFLAKIIPEDVLLIPAQDDGPSASVLAGLERFGTPLLVTTADNALLQPEWITEFLEALTSNSDVAAAVALEADILRDVPHTKRTYIRLTDMVFSGCNLFLFRTPVSTQVVDLWRHVEKNRKHPFRIAWTLGPMVILRALLGLLSSQALYKHLFARTGARAELIPLSDGRAAVDIDKPADIMLAEQIITTQSQK
ncbi:MAG: nucleotidyltransferase family protein [Acetobacter sp.]|nr:nucleotidyltransferase family protein [Acetobacter sp.]MBR2124885.1 nucleotidyltransferase family protein [Acetobacter sp.]